jgi:folate-binding protein YgfZ
VSASFFELGSTGLIAVRGADAVAFLQAQLTSDVASLSAGHTQYSGYCSPKGRLLATFALWRGDDEILLQLPETLCASIQARLAKYVLRAKVTLAHASGGYGLFGVAGTAAEKAVEPFTGGTAPGIHELVTSAGHWVARVSATRFVVLARAAEVANARLTLARGAGPQPESVWSRLEIEAGIPTITPATQDEYVPQMVNLDLIGAVSYTKGCYPGQEIVARTHYLGRLKQRMYRIHAATAAPPAPGDSLYSAAFGPEQASGAILVAAPGENSGYDALAVIQASAVASGTITLHTPDGPAVEFVPLPYSIPA